jgi:serine/threonine protein kinase
MLCGQPLFSASCEIGMLFSIFRVLGTPSVQNWPGCTKLPGWKHSFPSFAGAPLTELTDASGLTLPSDMADLLAQALRYDPVARISAQEAVQHQCFKRAKRRQRHAEVDAEAEPRRGTASHPEDSGVPVPLPPPPLQLKGNGRCQCGGNCSTRRHAVSPANPASPSAHVAVAVHLFVTKRHCTQHLFVLGILSHMVCATSSRQSN